ncbi:galactoside alpha-(1,2)-fucosyltransferase 2-like [Saccostrea cucullata]|uniref:galactoside alpha-(1,2)-fucosyltransferase 2-like n=1 Tax=Saccostrea cuccullata TaxID=36930 RepID=UPI002ED17419
MFITVVTLIIISKHLGPDQSLRKSFLNGTFRKHQVSSSNIRGRVELQNNSKETPNTRRRTNVSKEYTTWNASSLWKSGNIPLIKSVSTGMSMFSSIAKFTTSPASVEHKQSTEFYVCVKYIGRLGNNLFQFASGYGIAASKGMKLVVGVTDRIYQIFQIKNGKNILISKNKHECDNAIFRKERQTNSYDKDIVDFKPNATYRVGRCLQSWKYFHNVSNELREILKFRNHIQTKANKLMENVLRKYDTSRENVTLIAVHVRRGDMLTLGNAFSVATKEYFEKAFQYFRNYSSPIYVVCSNGMAWSKANIPKNYSVEFMYGNLPEEDLALMASCDHVISSVGSFSWWAGWFTNGFVTYYKWPVVEDSIRRHEYSSDFTDFFSPHWIGL